MPEVSLKHSSFPDGEMVEIPCLGSFANNGDAKFLEPNIVQMFINAGFPWPTEDLEEDVVLKLPPEPVKPKVESESDEGNAGNDLPFNAEDLKDHEEALRRLADEKENN